MGFYFRKSVKFGPLRLNFSKSGIGVSAGVKGARISTGPRGTYVHAGANGFYYKQKLGGSGNRQPSPSNQNGFRVEHQQPNFQSADYSEVHRIHSADVSELVDASGAQIISQINAAAKEMRYAPLAVLATLAASFIAFLIIPLILGALAGIGLAVGEQIASVVSFISFLLALAVMGTGGYYSWKIHKGDQLKRTTPLFYELEESAVAKFRNIQQACATLAQSAGIWRVNTNQHTWDQKRNAGATNLITRQPISVVKEQPPYIATNVEVWSLKLGSQNLYFLPDYIFVFQNGQYGAVSYQNFGVSFSITQYIESQGVPRDTQIVDYTWQYVNKKGGPDRRFNNNRQIPVVQYGFVQLTSSTGLNIHLHGSNVAHAKTFANVLQPGFSNNSYYRETKYSNTNNFGGSSATVNDKIKIAYEVLGVPFNTSPEQVRSAYLQMAKMYHPDRLSGLAPEFIDMAQERMKEINEAYEQLKRR